MPTLTLFAGTNGAGKSTLYAYQKSINDKADLGIRVNADEILRSFNGNWRSAKDNLKAGKFAVNLIKNCLKEKKSFNWELTIFTHYHLKLIKQAKELGYKINLYYVCVDSVKTAIERVHTREILGGHGIPEETIKFRYANQFETLPIALEYVDTAIFLDNTTSLKIVGTFVNNTLTYSSESTPWVKNLKFVCDDVNETIQN